MEIEAIAVLSNKRKHLNSNGSYVCDVECSACGQKDTMSFSGWSAIRCRNCKKDMQRGSYTRKSS